MKEEEFKAKDIIKVKKNLYKDQSYNILDNENTKESIKSKNISDYESNFHLATVFLKLNKYKEAEYNYKIASKYMTNNFELEYNLGIALTNLNKFEEAKLCFKKAISLNPSMAQAHYNLGWVIYKLGRSHEALDFYKEALKINPKYSECYNNIGSIFSDFNKLDEAIVMFRTAITLNSNYTAAYYNLANCLKKKGNLKDSENFYKKAIKLNPNFKEALNNLGNTLSNLGNLKESVNSFIKAIKIDPNYIEAWTNIIFPFVALRNLRSENTKYLNNILNKNIPNENIWNSILNYKIHIGQKESYYYFNKILNNIKKDKKLIIKNNNFKKKSLKKPDTTLKDIISLVHFGRSGTGLLHSLIDNHNEISTLPSIYLSQFFDQSIWKKIVSENFEKTIENFINTYPVLFDSRVDHPVMSIGNKFINNLGVKEGMTKLGPNKDEFLSVNKKIFKDQLIKLMHEYKEIDQLIFFKLVHIAYEKTVFGQNKKKKIFYHIHNPDTYAKIRFKYFDKNCKWLMMVRNPLDSCESWICKEYSENNYKDLVMRIITMLYDIDNDVFLNSNSIGCRLEDLKTFPRKVLPALCKWMNIKPTESLYQMTAQGKIWWGDTSSPYQEAFGKMLKKNISNIFKNDDRLILETLFYPFNVEFGYKKENTKVFKNNLKIIRPMLEEMLNFEKVIANNLKIDINSFKKTGIYLYFHSCLIRRWETLNKYNTYPNLIKALKI